MSSETDVPQAADEIVGKTRLGNSLLQLGRREGLPPELAEGFAAEGLDAHAEIVERAQATLTPGSDEYAKAAVSFAGCETLPNDGGVYASLPSFPGVYAYEATEDKAREVLGNVVKGWVHLRQEGGLSVPTIEQRQDPRTGDVLHRLVIPADMQIPRKSTGVEG